MFYRPKTVKEALSMKADLGVQGMFLAGGTDLVVGIRKNKLKVNHLIDLSRIEALREVKQDGAMLRIGACCPHSQLESSSIRALALATATVGGPQIRNLGTIGGQIGTASPAGDVSVALIALNADVELMSVRDTRRFPLSELFLSPGKTALAPDEMVHAVYVPTNRRSDFYKIGKRQAVAISLVMGAASVGPDGDWALGVGCVAPIPLRLKRAEAWLQEQGTSEESLARVETIVCEDVAPISDHRGGTDYRRAMAGVLTKRLVKRLAHEPTLLGEMR